ILPPARAANHSCAVGIPPDRRIHLPPRRRRRDPSQQHHVGSQRGRVLFPLVVAVRRLGNRQPGAVPTQRPRRVTMARTSSTNRQGRDTFYGRISGDNFTPLWEVMSAIITPEPKSG